MRFNHMELTFPRGTLDDVFRKEVDAFYGDVFGWSFVDTEVVGQLCHIMLTEDNGDFILLAESGKPMSSPGYDHLGFLQDTRGDVDELRTRRTSSPARSGRCRSRSTRISSPVISWSTRST